MKKHIKFVALIAMAVSVAIFKVYAAGNLADQKPIEVVLELDEFKFSPANLTFVTGKTYKLVIKNTGKVKHELDAEALKTLAYTRKLVVNDAKGNLLAEVKGFPTEVEVGPDTQVEWWFVPVQTGMETEMICLLEGHAEAGMRGTMTFK